MVDKIWLPLALSMVYFCNGLYRSMVHQCHSPDLLFTTFFHRLLKFFMVQLQSIFDLVCFFGGISPKCILSEKAECHIKSNKHVCHGNNHSQNVYANANLSYCLNHEQYTWLCTFLYNPKKSTIFVNFLTNVLYKKI